MTNSLYVLSCFMSLQALYLFMFYVSSCFMSHHTLRLFMLYEILCLQVIQMRIWTGWWWFCFWTVFIRSVYRGCYL